MLLIHHVADFLDGFFHTKQYPDDPRILQASDRPIRRIALALEPWPGMAGWVSENGLDAVFLHRSESLTADALPPEIGVVTNHRGFDDQLTLGFNPRLADALGMSAISVLGRKEGRPVGMIGLVPSQQVAHYFRRVRDVFGGYEESRTCEQDRVTRVAVVGAMNKALVHQASERGANVYITGQFRQTGRVGVLETGIGVVIVGHQRSEEWGLSALAGILRERWAGIGVVLAPPHQTK